MHTAGLYQCTPARDHEFAVAVRIVLFLSLIVRGGELIFAFVFLLLPWMTRVAYITLATNIAVVYNLSLP